ncbi:MAG TPA: ABC transporter ATP-binding protein [Sphingobacteriaceae bacterium]|nr:ABC transporter ATP-binding protein [Sphingobacteriaceae bacterium]
MIEIKDLTFGYSKKYPLFENINFSLKLGHIYGLLGKNGAGKSTLIKNIAGLAFPQKGVCKVNNRDASRRSPGFLEDLFLIPEEIYLPSVSIKEFIRNTAVFYPKFDHGQFHEYLKEFDLDIHVKIHNLSFGQQKKVMIAFGMATNTDIFIMDEPTNGLDIPSKVQFRKIVSSALTEHRCILISTHQVRDLDNLIDALVVMNNRRIVLNLSVDAISEKLLFSTVNAIEDVDVLYTESSVKGHHVISSNAEKKSSRVDLELLFNALITDEAKIIHELNQITNEQYI